MNKALTVLLALLLLSACAGSEFTPIAPAADTHPVHVSFMVQGTGDTPSRAEGENPAEENTRPLYVDCVQLNIYRRPAGTYADDLEGLTLNLTVNPHWAGDADLTLGGK